LYTVCTDVVGGGSAGCALAAGRRLRIDADEVVLAAGAIASPQLLLLSGIGPAADLRALGIDVVADLA
jgi:choline dehydrogenase-like flavoprotein